MAIYQGTRVRSMALPAAPAARPRPRVPASGSVGGTARIRPMGIVLAGILAGTMVGMAYLTQTLGSSATSSEIARLETKKADLIKDLNIRAGEVVGLIERDAIEREARGLGFRDLGKAVRLKGPTD